MKNRKGFTLIELLAVIVILAIIAVIAVPKILNMIEDARKSSVKDSAYGYVKSIENKIAQSSLKGITYEDKEDYAYEDIQVDMKGTRPTYVRYSLKKGMVESGVFCIDDYIVNYTNKEVTVGGRCNEDELKLPGNVEISVSSENYTYPNSGKFKVTTNISGGALSCTTSDKEVATCSISGDEVTVTPGKKEGKADITVKSATTSKHKEAQAVHVAITAKGTIPSVTATGYEGIYDGEEHGITVSATLDGATIKYGESNETYDKDVSPTYKDVGTYTVYYEITKEGYTTITGNKTVTIEKAEGNVTAPSAKTLTYTGSDQTLINAGSSSTGEIQYKLGNSGTYSTSLPSATNAGTYTVYYKVIGDKNHNNVEEKFINVTIAKASNTLTLSAGSATYIYPTSKTFEITKNTSGGTLSCISSNTNIATCSINGTTVTVIPGTTAGSSTITIKSAATANYNEISVSHTAITVKGTIPSVTANGYSGTYDGKAHGITVSTTLSGATIKYGTANGSYTSTTNPTYTNAGTYTVYYQISKAGYETVTGSKKIEIEKSSGLLTISSTNGEINVGESITLTTSESTGMLSCKSNNTNVATCSVSGTTIIVNGIAPGTTTITINSAATTNYNEISKTYSVTVKQLLLSSNVKYGDYISMTPQKVNYVVSSSLTGYTSDQTINPSELNLWRVIKINNDGTIEMVSEYVSNNFILFAGETGYKNLVGTLNTIAAQYANSNYTIATRHMGYNGQTNIISTALSSSTCGNVQTNGNTLETSGCGDTLYTTDIELVRPLRGHLSTSNANKTSTYSYWLASRYFYPGGSSGYWRGRFLQSGALDWVNLIGSNTGTGSAAIRPIVTLKSGITASGSGTSSDPYVLP